MSFTFFGGDFIVTEAVIGGGIKLTPKSSGEAPEYLLFWSISVDAEHQPKEHETMKAEDIQFSQDSFTASKEIVRWTDLVGASSQMVSDEYKWSISDPMLYMSWHTKILQSTLRIIEREGVKLHIEWSGIVENQAFSFDCWAIFEGISVICGVDDNEATIRSIFAEHLNVDDFIQHPKTDHRTFSIARFEPKI